MTTVTFGVVTSPFAAIRTLQQTDIDFGTEFLLASPHVSSPFCVDDFLAGAQNVDEAIILHINFELSCSRVGLTSGNVDPVKWQS